MNNLNVTIPVNAYERTVVEDPTPQSIPFDYDVNGLIDFDKCTGKELSTLMTFVFPNSGWLSKLLEIKSGKFCERVITPQNIQFLA